MTHGGPVSRGPVSMCVSEREVTGVLRTWSSVSEPTLKTVCVQSHDLGSPTSSCKPVPSFLCSQTVLVPSDILCVSQTEKSTLVSRQPYLPVTPHLSQTDVDPGLFRVLREAQGWSVLPSPSGVWTVWFRSSTSSGSRVVRILTVRDARVTGDSRRGVRDRRLLLGQ